MDLDSITRERGDEGGCKINDICAKVYLFLDALQDGVSATQEAAIKEHALVCKSLPCG